MAPRVVFFVIASGGAYIVNGPLDSVMEGNNSLGGGLSMLIPLLYFLMQQTTRRWHRYALVTAMLLCAASVLGANSLGAMLSATTMSLLLWLRGRNKVAVLVLVLALVTLAIPAIPAMLEHWFAKMNTMRTYDQYDSAMFLRYTWEAAYKIGKDRFPLAGGFEWESPAASLKYSPLATLVLVAHGEYFSDAAGLSHSKPPASGNLSLPIL